MKRLNLLNQIFVVILVGFLLAIVIKRWKYNGGSRFYYSGAVTAPRLYPVKVRDVYFILPNDEIASISNSEVNDDRGSDWGHGDFEETHERLPLPQKLVLKYVSYRDQKFYRDTLQLPAKLLDSIFRNSEKNDIRVSIYKPGGNVTGLNFLIGVANKGNVVVWLQGKNYEQVILKHQLNAKVPVGEDLYYGKQMSRAEYLKEKFQYLSEELLKQIADGIDQNANYIDSPSNYIRKPM